MKLFRLNWIGFLLIAAIFIGSGFALGWAACLLTVSK